MCQPRNRAGFKVFLAEAGSLGVISEAVFFLRRMFHVKHFLDDSEKTEWQSEGFFKFRQPDAVFSLKQTLFLPAEKVTGTFVASQTNDGRRCLPFNLMKNEHRIQTGKGRPHLAAAHMGKGFCFSACLVPSLLCRCNCTDCTGI